MSFPIDPPKEWFQPPPDGIPTDKRITIQSSGQVYGYIALWDTCHVGMGGCVKPPKGSPSAYEYAHQGETLTAEGDMIKTAVIGGGSGHAPVDMATANVPKYYESIDKQLMRVRFGEDENGLWFAGALWPEVDDLQVAQIRASSISGDWRWHAAWRKASASDYDFAGACLVNIPGFPMPAAGNINSDSGVPYALAASAFMPVEVAKADEYVFLTEDTPGGITAAMDEDEKCDGSCSSCSCGKVEDEQPKEEAAPIKADLDMLNSDAENQIHINELADSIKSIKEAVDWLVADKLVSQIVEDTVPEKVESD